MDTVNLKKHHTGFSQDNIARSPVFPLEPTIHGSTASFVNIERRIQNHTVFQVDDTTFISSHPAPTHWSIAWSDLMMTMFILFLSMFVYQAANEEFLGEKGPEILGGDTTGALQSMDAGNAAFPFAPIHPGIPLMTAGTIKKVERVHADRISSEGTSDEENQQHPGTENKVSQEAEPSDTKRISQEQTALMLPQGNTVSPTPKKNSIRLQPPEEVLEPFPFNSTESKSLEANDFQEIYILSKSALEDNKLDKFAAIDIIPDKTVRIILTSDLLFALGKSELSDKAKESLRKIAHVIRLTPYMINVVGHTDNIPMQSYRFKSNWELSVARATTVTRFLIDEIGMDPKQFVVSGYSSYRPVRPNTNAENRAKNRRVEIIISKRLPNPAQPTTKNFQ